MATFKCSSPLFRMRGEMFVAGAEAQSSSSPPKAGQSKTTLAPESKQKTQQAMSKNRVDTFVVTCFRGAKCSPARSGSLPLSLSAGQQTTPARKKKLQIEVCKQTLTLCFVIFFSTKVASCLSSG